MATITLSDILDDLRAADQALHKFEQCYWLSSRVFDELYSQGLLDDGSHAEDFAEWAGHYQLKLKREAALGSCHASGLSNCGARPAVRRSS